MFDNFKRELRRGTPVDEPIPLDYTLALQGFGSATVRRLNIQRGRFLSGELNEWPEEYGRLRFAHWQYEHGKIGG